VEVHQYRISNYMLMNPRNLGTLLPTVLGCPSDTNYLRGRCYWWVRVGDMLLEVLPI